MASTISTPTRTKTHSTKAFESDAYPSPTGSNQDSMKIAVGLELQGHTWQFDTNRLAKVFLPKTRKSPLKPDQIDNIDAYVYKTISSTVLRNALTSFRKHTPLFPVSGPEPEHYDPLCKLLNRCVEVCHNALGNSKGEYYSGLKFVEWDNPTQDGCPGEHRLKPDLAGGIDLPGREEIKANGGLFWRRQGSNRHELLIPVEVKKGWKDLVRQAGTYARCLFMASPLRKFALVLGYEYDLEEFRILIFHHGGLTSSQALKLDGSGIKDLLHIFLAILSWNTVVDAGLPLWCNDSNMFLPGAHAVQVKKVLHNTLALRGRCARVHLVCEDDESKSIPIILAPESIYAPRRSARILQSKPGHYLPSLYFEYVLTISYPASNTNPMPKATGAFLITVLRWCLSGRI
jgi:hypothetical protein